MGIDMVAGPTEVLILADETAQADLIAADLIARAEHDEDAASWLATTSRELADAIPRSTRGGALTAPRADVARAPH
ncbi:MAG: histidinol dehydrogenase [Gemmatimonadetes bacterium]|nr:histidinol dehydrogenase [Gemmatimonadota bacterium]